MEPRGPPEKLRADRVVDPWHSDIDMFKAGSCARSILFSLLTVMGSGGAVNAQTPAEAGNGPATPASQPSINLDRPRVDLKSLPRNLFIDQKKFWTAPFHMTQAQWEWTIPLGAMGAALIASDTAIEQHVPTHPTTVSHANTASNAGLAAMAGVGAGMFLWGHVTHHDQERETGILSGEAGVDAFLDTEAFAYIFRRDRPFTGNGKGRFFQSGDSFPSQHAAISWAIASVMAHEYPGPATELLAYGAATGVGVARWVAHQHFASDVIVGSAWLVSGPASLPFSLALQ